MGFSLSTHFPSRIDRDAALKFFQGICWKDLGLPDDQAPPALVGGKQLLYKPNVRPELLIGFNTEQITDTQLAIVAWLAARSGAMYNQAGVMHIDTKSISIVSPGDPHQVPGTQERWKVNPSGILDPASQLPAIERFLRRREHQQRVQVLEKLSEQWPVGNVSPHSLYQGKNPLFQSYPRPKR